MSDPRIALATLFREAGQAHHEAFAATNGEDPDWPEWYARYLTPAVAEIVGRALPSETLASELRAVDAEMRAKAAAADWTLYYADWFLSRTGLYAPQ